MYIMFANDYDPGMRYEGLARTAFDCGKWGGPDGIAHQEFYNNFVPDLNSKAINALKQILSALMEKVGRQAQSDLKTVLESLDNGMPQESGIELIDYVIKICEEES
jgi:hypothetical protein